MQQHDIELIQNENYELRYLLWLNHGCSMITLYGDDGELQCGKCMLDFKRDSIETIKNKLWIGV